MSESTVPAENYAEPTEGVAVPKSGSEVPQGHSSYRGAPYHDNPTKLPEPKQEADSGEGEAKDGTAPTYTQPPLPGLDTP